MTQVISSKKIKKSKNKSPAGGGTNKCSIPVDSDVYKKKQKMKFKKFLNNSVSVRFRIDLLST